MLMQMGMLSSSFLPAETFNAHYAAGNPPSVSYLYTPHRQSYLFPDSQMQEFSFIPAIEIKDKKIIFTLNQKPAISYDDLFIFSLPDLLKKIKLPPLLDQDLLDKIATIANYLAQGKNYEYVNGTARQQNSLLNFLVKKGDNYCRVTLPAFQDKDEIEYEEINDEDPLLSNTIPESN